MTMRLAATVASDMADVITAAVDAGSAAGTIKVYTGTQPASVTDTATGTLLATFTLADPSAAAAVAGVVTLDSDPEVTATVAADGDPGWLRVADSDGTVVFDGAVGTGGEASSSASSWVSGGTVSLSGTITQPQASS